MNTQSFINKIPLHLFFNGPPKCGKNTIANGLLKIMDGFDIAFADPLNAAVFSHYALEETKLSLEILDKEKHTNKRYPELFNQTWREARIKFATEIRHFDDAHYAKLMCERYKRVAKLWYEDAVTEEYAINNYIICYTDLGYDVEFEYFVRTLPEKAVAIVNVYREGTDFSLDNRKYITSDKHVNIRLDNNDTVENVVNRLIIQLNEHYIMRRFTNDVKTRLLLASNKAKIRATRAESADSA
jgi:hypothetical protein